MASAAEGSVRGVNCRAEKAGGGVGEKMIKVDRDAIGTAAHGRSDGAAKSITEKE